MGRRALFTEAEVFAKADEMAAQGLDVSAISLVRELGGGSLGTMQKHTDKWQATREKSEATPNAEMPESIKNLFHSAWRAMEAETTKKLSRYHEFCDLEIQRHVREAQESGAYAVGLERENESLEKAVQELRDTTAAQNALTQELRDQARRLEVELKAEREQRISALSSSNTVEKNMTAEIGELRALNTTLTDALAQSEAKLANAEAAVLAAKEANAALRGKVEQLEAGLQAKQKRA